MSRNKKFILNAVIVVLIVGVLGAGVYFLTRPEEEPSLSEIYTDDDTIKIFSADSAQFTRTEITNSSGSYVLEKTDGAWNLQGFSGISLNVNMLDNLTRYFGDVTSSMRVEENPADLSAYGLDSPSAVVKISTTDREKTFNIGSKTPDGLSYYFNTDTSSDVYLLDSVSADVAFLSARDYADLKSGFTAEEVTDIRISSKTGDVLHVSMNSDGPKDQYGLLSYWQITEPVDRSASNSDVSSLLASPAAEMENSISAIMADSEENRRACGLDEPEYTVEISAGEKITYYIGAADGEYRYFRREGENYILRGDESGMAFVRTSVYDVSEKYLALIDIAMLDTVEISFSGQSTLFTAVDGGGENAAFYAEGKELNPDDFRKFYQQIIAIEVSGEAENPAYENIVGTIEYTLNTKDKIKLEFVPYDERNYAVFVNGQGQYTILKKNVDKIFDLYKEFV